MTEEKNVVSTRDSNGNIVQIETYDFIPSTHARAKECAKLGYPDRYVIFSEKQLKTALTSNKASDTEIEKGMFISLILRPSIFPSQAPLLGAMSATAMVTAFEEHTTKPLGLGWVSDVYCDGARIGSVSIEGKLDNYTTYEYIIITFAARLDEDNFPPRLNDMIKKVFESENTSISMIIARNVLNKFFRHYANLKTSSKFMETYNKKFILRGEKVKYLQGDKKRTCRVLNGETKTGALIPEMKDGSVKNVTTPASVTTPKKIRIKKVQK